MFKIFMFMFILIFNFHYFIDSFHFFDLVKKRKKMQLFLFKNIQKGQNIISGKM